MSEKTAANGHGLEEAMALLINNQAALVGRQAETDRAQVEFQRQQVEFQRKHLEFEAETKERFLRIEGQMAEIIRVLKAHTAQLERLTDAVREKIGFKQ